MNTDPINLAVEPIPEGWTLIEGRQLQNSARPAKIPFRVVREPNDKNCWSAIGIAIPDTSLAHWKEVQARAAARKGEEVRLTRKAKAH